MTAHDRRRPGPRRVGQMAVVVGASIAGLCAARVLSERFDEVLLVDRDELPDHPRWRGQVPQGRHPHLLLVSGARLLEGWFPGIGAELAAHGAIDFDICRDFLWVQGGLTLRRPSSTLRGPAMSRPLLEWTIRRRTATLPNVSLRGATPVSGVDIDHESGQVRGVRLDGGSVVACDLVVDATGRQARSLAWLQDAGYPAPARSVVEVDTRYVSRVYRRNDEPGRDWQGAALVGEPATKRLAMVLPMEEHRWILMLGGLNGEAPPTDDEGMLAFARSLGPPAIANLMQSSEPLGDTATYRFPANQRRHVEKLRRFPAGWLMIGDAVASFDPIYGQGMTVAAQQADALGECLDRAAGTDHSFARRYFRRVGRVVAAPWSIATGGDFAYPGTVGRKPAGTDLFNRYSEKVLVAGVHDDQVVVRFNEVQALLRRPEALITPPFLLRVWRGARRGPTVPGQGSEVAAATSEP